MKTTLTVLVLPGRPRTELQDVLGVVQKKPDLDTLAFDLAADRHVEDAADYGALAPVVDGAFLHVLSAHLTNRPPVIPTVPDQIRDSVEEHSV